MTYPISDVTRRVIYSGSAGVGPYSFSFEVLDQGDVAVYLNTTLLTITTDYTVTINANGTGSITLVTAATASDTVAILGNKGIERQTDFVTGGDLFANSLNDELDAQTIFAQQNAEAVSRALKLPPYSSLSISSTLPVPQANYILGWNSTADGVLNYQEIGNYKGTDAATTTVDYVKRDIVKESVYGNVYICIADSTAGTLLTNTSYWALIFDASPNNWYLGSQASDPSVDNYGDPVIAGHWYFNSTDDVVYVYNGSSWQTSAVTPASVQQTAEEQAVSFAIALG